MEQRNTSQLFWQQALMGGLILGIVLFVWDLIGYWLDLPGGASAGIASLVQFALLIAGIIYFTQKLREQRGPAAGLSYGQAFGFVLALMLCSGVVYGAGLYFLQAVIAPDYYRQITLAALESSSYAPLMRANPDMERMMFAMLTSPVFYLFAGVVTLMIYGGLIGLVACAVLRRPADPFADESPNRNDQSEA
jgi:hypothetical protein